MYPKIKSYCDQLTKEFDSIPAKRKVILDKIAAYIGAKINAGLPANLVYICTHNARRSHFGQVWAHVAANYYGLANVFSHSGGSEVTAFHLNAIASLKRTGFEVNTNGQLKNPVYSVRFDKDAAPASCFSKVYDDPSNPQENFAAIMVCGDAEQNCPFVAGADMRISTTYEDPKSADNTPGEDETYDARSRQIAIETFYVFSQVKP